MWQFLVVISFFSAPVPVGAVGYLSEFVEFLLLFILIGEFAVFPCAKFLSSLVPPRYFSNNRVALMCGCASQTEKCCQHQIFRCLHQDGETKPLVIGLIEPVHVPGRV